jgi:hypothetical protein
MMFRIALTSFALLVTGNVAFAQPVRSQLTNELVERINRGANSPDKKDGNPLMEAQVLKLLPIAFRIARPYDDSDEVDEIIVSAETTEFEFEFIDGKLSSHSATFHPTANSQQLTLERFHEIKDGMTKEAVEKLFGQELGRARPSEKRAGQAERYRYVRGRELEIYISNGKVAGARLKAYLDK